MKLNKFGLICLLSLFFWSCDDKKESSIDEIKLPSQVKVESDSVKPVKKYTLEKQNNWEAYYKKEDKSFDLDNFKKDESFKIVRNKSDLTPIWSNDFNPVYKEFLAFNADSTKYIDVDSYKWGFDDNGELVIGPDQEIVLVNIPEKKVERLLFYGPSFWVEEAYFKNDSIVVLLENSTEKIPAYQEININQNKSDYYIYKQALPFESTYLKNRITGIYKRPM